MGSSPKLGFSQVRVPAVWVHISVRGTWFPLDSRDIPKEDGCKRYFIFLFLLGSIHLGELTLVITLTLSQFLPVLLGPHMQLWYLPEIGNIFLSV